MLESLIGCSREHFLAEYRGKAPFYAAGAASNWCDVLSWAELNQLLDTPGRMLDQMFLVRENQHLDRGHFVLGTGFNQRLVPGALRKAITEGYSLSLNYMGNYSRKASLLSDFATTALGERVDVNAYISWRAQKGFLTHWDDHDVVIIQTEGEKDWRVFEPTREHPFDVDIEGHEDPPAELRLAWSGRLFKGDALYIPRGWWHDARATGVGSIHLTLGFRSRTGMDVLNFMLQEAMREARFRCDAPRRGEAGESVDGASFERQMIEFVREQVEGGLLTRFWCDHYAKLPARSRHHLPTALSMEDFCARKPVIQVAALSPEIPIEVSEQSFSISIGRKRWDLALPALKAVEALLSGGAVDVDELAETRPGGLVPDDVRTLMFELLNDGIVNLVESEQGLVSEAPSQGAKG